MTLSVRWWSALVVVALSACAPDAPGAKPHRDSPWDIETRADALSSGVVISQVYGGGGNANATYKNDFIELFNRGSTSVNISGWSVQYAGDTNLNWTVTALGDAGVLAPGQYFLVSGASGGAVGATLPTANVTGTSNLSATAGKVALVSNATALGTNACPTVNQVVDLVAYGSTATCAETAPVTPAPSNILSATRNTAGCSETDNNDVDLTSQTPAARNKASPLNVCGTAPDAGVTDAGVTDAGVVDAGCLVLTSWPTVFSQAGYSAAATTASAELFTQVPANADGGMDLLTLEAYFGNGTLTIPATATYTTASDYATCDLCPIVRRGCGTTGCRQRFFAQAGTANVTAATENELAGRFTGTLTNIKFVEWDFGNDVPVTNGACIQLASVSINLTWDAGTPPTPDAGSADAGGTTTDAGSSGTDAGAGGDDAGVDDAGVVDAGKPMGGGAGGGGGRPPRIDGGSGGGGGTTNDAGSMGGGSGGGSGTTGGGSGTLGGGSGTLGGGIGGGTGGGGGAKAGGCSCATEETMLMPFVMLGLAMFRARRRTRPY